MRCWSLHCTHNLGQVQVQEPKWPTTKQRQRHCQKVTFAKERKNREGWGRGVSHEMKTQMHHPESLIYKLIENINIMVFGTKSKHQEELNSDTACVIHIFSNKIGHLLKINKGSLKSTADWFPNDELRLIWSPYLIRGCSITFFYMYFPLLILQNLNNCTFQKFRLI